MNYPSKAYPQQPWCHVNLLFSPAVGSPSTRQQSAVMLSATLMLCFSREMYFLSPANAYSSIDSEESRLPRINYCSASCRGWWVREIWAKHSMEFQNPFNAKELPFCLFLILSKCMVIPLTANCCNCLIFSISGSFVHCPIFGAD